MHTFKTVSDIRIAPGGAAKLDMFVDGLCANKRIAIVTDKGVRGLGLKGCGISALESAGYLETMYGVGNAKGPKLL